MHRICIVDDDEAVRDSLTVLLEACGYAIAAFASALAFLDAPELGGFLCLIVDVHMPGMNGLELLELLRGRGLVTPAILISAASDARLRVAASRLGRVTFLDKPLDGDKLLDAIAATGQVLS